MIGCVALLTAVAVGMSVERDRRYPRGPVDDRLLYISSGRTITVPLLTQAQFLELRTVRVLLEGLAAEAAARQSGPALASELHPAFRRKRSV